VFALFLSGGPFGPMSGEVFGFLFLVLLLSIGPLIGSLIVFITLIMLGKRLTSIQKGFLWKPGELRMDRNLKKYLMILTVLGGLLFLIQIISFEPSFGMFLSALLFGSTLIGLFSVNKLYAMPEFVSKLETPSYKTGPGFWWGAIIIALFLQFLPVLFSTIQPSFENDSLPKNSDVPFSEIK
jgi:hypothetical protein